MKVLIACEESQTVCKAFRAKGHEAYSCDIIEPSGGHPEWHMLGDALAALNGGVIVTMDGVEHDVGKWDMLIAHPPCTHLAASGERWFAEGNKPLYLRFESAAFFLRFAEADIPKICVENPVGKMSTYFRRPDCIIQPYEFGHHARKKTCLWLKGLPALRPTNVVDAGDILPGGYSVGASADSAKDETGKILRWNDPRTAKIRSKTFPGIAKAMAEQWG